MIRAGAHTAPSYRRRPDLDRWRPALAAIATLSGALLLSWIVRVLQAPLREQTEKAVSLTAALFAVILAVAPTAYLVRMGRGARPESASLLVLSTLSVLLLAIYFFWVGWYVAFPADILIWSEGDYVNDMLKFSAGYPIYSPPVNNNSFAYVPGSQLLTYFIAWGAGKAGSIPVYRVIQLGYTAFAAFLAMLCCRRVLQLAKPSSPALRGWAWNIFWYAACFLVATNSITNRFAHNLHGDALAQLASIGAYYLLLLYVEKPAGRVLAGMILLVPVGFLIKQNFLTWGLLYGGFLLIWGRSWKRVAVFVAVAAMLSFAAFGICYIIWGYPFYYWTFYLFRHHPVSPLRSFQHVLDAWAYYAAGLVGGLAVLRGRKLDALTGAWLIWLALLAVETYTSGIAWMLNHMGPGCLIAGIWLLAGLASVSSDMPECAGPLPPETWMRMGAITAVVALMFSGMGLIRIPLRPVPADAYRYVHDIEREFEGQDASRILLDVGSWVYVKDRVIMGDRASAIGEEGYANTGDFSGLLSRISAKYYSKILVRDLHEPDFWYENSQWPRPRGLRGALLETYRETGKIRGAAPPKDVKHWAEDPYLFDDVTILEPKPDAPSK